MDEIVYQALDRYYNVLSRTGYMSYDNVVKLLILAFYRDFVYSDYRCTLKKDDYRLIEKALDCLYGSTCLIPYPDYLKMGKLNLGALSEMACRIKAMEDANVVKVIHNKAIINADENSDVIVTMDDTETLEYDESGNTPYKPVHQETNPTTDKPLDEGQTAESGTGTDTQVPMG